MPDEASVATIRAAVEVIVPPVDDAPGAADLGVERHVVDLVEKALPGMSDLVATLLDAYAADVRPGTPFAALDAGERSQVLRAMCREESQDVRDAVDALLLFTLGGVYSEWTGYDREAHVLAPPASWGDVGFAGPVFGHPDYADER